MLQVKSPRASDRLLDGYRKFRQGQFAQDRGLYRRLVEEGQRPSVMLISCADSRVPPTTIFSAGPGDIFIARNVANIVPPYKPGPWPRSLGAAAEYAVKVLQVSDIVVLGHAHCGGVNALVSGGQALSETDYLKAWVEVAAPARQWLPADFASLDPQERGRLSEQAVIALSVVNLMTYPWIASRRETGDLELHGWRFDITDGSLSMLDREAREFTVLR